VQWTFSFGVPTADKTQPPNALDRFFALAELYSGARAFEASKRYGYISGFSARDDPRNPPPWMQMLSFKLWEERIWHSIHQAVGEHLEWRATNAMPRPDWQRGPVLEPVPARVPRSVRQLSGPEREALIAALIRMRP
jgi:hypothetical protein